MAEKNVHYSEYTGNEIDALLKKVDTGNVLSGTLYSWMDNKYQAYRLELFNNLWDVLTTISNNSYWADKLPSVTLTVTVTTKFNGELTDPTELVNGAWEKVGIGTYKLESNLDILSSSFTYKSSEGEWKDFTTTKDSKISNIDIHYPMFYGFVKIGATAQEAYDFLKENSRYEMSVFDSGSIFNSIGEDGVLAVLTHSNASITSFGFEILKLVNSNVNIIVNDDITLRGYKFYLSNNSASNGKSFDGINYSFNI